MGNKNVVHICNEIDSAENKNENVKISDKWMEVKNIISSKVTQVPKDKWAMFSFTCESQL